MARSPAPVTVTGMRELISVINKTRDDQSPTSITRPINEAVALAGHAAAVSYDPSFLLRTSQPKKYKAQTWADLQFAAQLPSQAE